MEPVVFCGVCEFGVPASGRVWASGRPYEVRGRGSRKSDPGEPPLWGFYDPRVVRFAWALLRECVASVRAADMWADEYARQVVSVLPNRWVLTCADVLHWYRSVRPAEPTLQQGELNVTEKMADFGGAGGGEPGHRTADDVSGADLAPSQSGAP